MGYDLTGLITEHGTGAFRFRPLTEDDLPMLSDWLGREHLQGWWHEQDISTSVLRQKYLPEVRSEDDAKPFIVVKEKRDIGYIQYYSVTHGNHD